MRRYVKRSQRSGRDDADIELAVKLLGFNALANGDLDCPI